ncbi:hypothetical protein ThidrDRAFT_1993 [Thiorhodococcus drewsii AZ1]|uniref:Uncharacterized protein n=1 Tax=Thiorhodococcus drewsii AZ1 TaxID=765913 RepID=G2E130_9GAMM|nr:hypothetical protein [Thiorhodococcus drewsii]EGV31371.1 hypothetical protein ThidrDRAFT_1993 [Thiorhodococcus drewsii AZ1]
MPFVGVQSGREALFEPQPRVIVAVNDAAAWRLNPEHRQVYDKLSLALAAGLRAAPCGVDPIDCGVAPDARLFVKPVVNLAGMALNARSVPADRVPMEPGSFWCEHLIGEHLSSDCLVRDGEPIWFAHTRASRLKDRERPVYWDVGVELGDEESALVDMIRRCLPGYTGLCNLEMIGGRPIEMHLRGSNGFFDLYGSEFIPAWVALVDGESFAPPPPVSGGLVISLFGTEPPSAEQIARVREAGGRLQLDVHTSDRAAIVRCHDRRLGMRLLRELGLDG